MPSLGVPGVFPANGASRGQAGPIAGRRQCLPTVAARLGSYRWNSHGMAGDTDRSTYLVPQAAAGTHRRRAMWTITSPAGDRALNCS